MKRLLGIFGVGILLLIVNTDASVNSNRNFWKLPWGSYDQAAPASGSDDLTFENEGSGFDENDKGTTGTHEDDEDYDESSGDSIIDLTPDDDDDNDIKKDDDDVIYEDNDDKNTGPSDDEDDDDDDDLMEGSGSGEGVVEEVIVPNKAGNIGSGYPGTTQAPKKPLTACENLQKSAMMVDSSFMPECDEEGAFNRVQCMLDAGTSSKNCWCVDPSGIEIAGTRMAHPEVPDCLYGDNLSPCVKKLVQNSQGLMGAFKPRCTEKGEYETVQCLGSECWCVDVKGNEIVGTVSNKPNLPKCPSVTDPKVLDKPSKPDKTADLPNTDDGYTISGDNKEDINEVVVNVRPGTTDDESNIELEEERTNTIGEPYATMRHNEPILRQPGLLAAIIGGAVVGLLCMVLLVMFIVYRMRKKDEGSYPLDEQKYQNYSYAKAPDKEFYA